MDLMLTKRSSPGVRRVKEVETVSNPCSQHVCHGQSLFWYRQVNIETYIQIYTYSIWSVNSSFKQIETSTKANTYIAPWESTSIPRIFAGTTSAIQIGTVAESMLPLIACQIHQCRNISDWLQLTQLR